MNKNIAIVLQSYSATRDSMGAEVKTWSTYATVQGADVTQRQRSYDADEGVVAETVLEFRIWYRTDIEPKHRALIGGEAYEVQGHPQNIRHENREMILRLRRVE